MSSIYQAEKLKLKKDKNGKDWDNWVTECKIVHRSFGLKVDLLIILNVIVIVLHIIHHFLYFTR